MPRWPDVSRSDITAALRWAVAEADAALLAAAGAAGGDALPDGTTAAVVLLRRAELLVAWLGDSRAVLCRWEGSERCETLPRDSAAADPGGRARLVAVALTEDHSPGRPDERARILASGGTVTASPGGERPNTVFI